jgi:2'-5' RNA ligase
MRTFIAIELPTPVQEFIAARQQSVRATLDERGAAPGLRWVPTEKLHLTLRFLGDTTTAQRQAMHAHLGLIAGRHGSFDLAPSALGCFPNMGRPSVIWLGLDGNGAKLQALQRDVEDAAQQAGFAAESRAYAPHLTLARVDRSLPSAARRHLSQVLAEIVRTPAPVTPPAFAVDSFVHMQSVLKPAGAEYTVLARFALET